MQARGKLLYNKVLWDGNGADLPELKSKPRHTEISGSHLEIAISQGSVLIRAAVDLHLINYNCTGNV